MNSLHSACARAGGPAPKYIAFNAPGGKWLAKVTAMGRTFRLPREEATLKRQQAKQAVAALAIQSLGLPTNQISRRRAARATAAAVASVTSGVGLVSLSEPTQDVEMNDGEKDGEKDEKEEEENKEEKNLS